MPIVNLQSDHSELRNLLADMWTIFIKSKSKTGFKMLKEYLLLCAFFFVFFAAIYSIIYWAFYQICKKKTSAFQQMDRIKKLEYVGRVVSIIHAIAVTITSAYGCFYIW